MHLKTRNVNTAFKTLVEKFAGNGVSKPTPGDWNPEYTPIVRKESRNGPVLMIDEPILITYRCPWERVLFNPARDANPFFHLYEALWMLAGRNDVASVAYYASNMANYSDDGKTLNGAYGYRWRHAKAIPNSTDIVGYDQLDILVNHLKADPTSRRAVLQMWNVEDDLLKIGKIEPLVKDRWLGSKDVCCNLSVMFSIREEHNYERDLVITKYLDMTVTNRSNDMIWGLLGANYVHFTILQEYMAARLGVEVGLYHHFTNNLHIYESNWKPEEWLKDAHIHNYGYHVGAGAEPTGIVSLVWDSERFEKETAQLVDLHDGRGDYTDPIKFPTAVWGEPFLENVVRPALNAFHHYKRKDLDSALAWAGSIIAEDWRIACTRWLERRKK